MSWRRNAAGHALEQQGQRLLQRAFDQWVQRRHEERETEVITAARFAEWLSLRPAREQSVAKRTVIFPRRHSA